MPPSITVPAGAAGDRVLAVVDEDGRVDEVAVFILVPDAEFGKLAGSSAVRIFMAIDAGGCVIDGPESGLHGVVLFLDLLIMGKGVSGGLDDSVANALCAVEAGSVEPCRRFRC
jgi:hypothetical protein